MKHIMIDLETLGTTVDSVILSIGAVKFDLDSDKMDDAGFYASVSIDSNLDIGRVVNESTINWWMKQSAEARQVFAEPKQSLEAALASLSEWAGRCQRIVWSNGANFDIPMLEHAYNKLGWFAPWEFYNTRCVRTYKSLPAAARVPKPANDHNALRDAVNQARYVQAIQAAMKVMA